jgi:hypothetical protein
LNFKNNIEPFDIDVRIHSDLEDMI